MKEVNKANGRFQCAYWGIAAAVLALVGAFLGWKYAWIVGLPAGILSAPIGKRMQKRHYESIVGEKGVEPDGTAGKR